MTYEGESDLDATLGKGHLSFLADALVKLGLVTSDGYARRTVSVAKMRGNAHDKAIREWFIERGNLHVGDVYQNGFRDNGAGRNA
jgi:KaiC/GvpD/RAD55 family RecA-like ATPase